MRTAALALVAMSLMFAASRADAQMAVMGPIQPGPYGYSYYYNPATPPYRGPAVSGVYGWVGDIGYRPSRPFTTMPKYAPTYRSTYRRWR